MTPLAYEVFLKNGVTANVHADTIIEPHVNLPVLVLKDGATVLAKFNAEDVAGWRVSSMRRRPRPARFRVVVKTPGNEDEIRVATAVDFTGPVYPGETDTQVVRLWNDREDLGIFHATRLEIEPHE